MSELVPGFILAKRYRIEGILGEGGMATVYRAVHLKNGNTVVVKAMHSRLLLDPRFVERFMLEANVLKSLEHPNIVRVLDAGEDGAVLFIVLEYVAGASLQRLIATGPLPWQSVSAIIADTSRALGHAHARGILHRDIKPANILVTDTGRAVLTDFGLAHLVDRQSPTNPGTILGTPDYMSPEQLAGAEGTASSDIYGLGVVLYQCLSGHLPFEGTDPVEVAHRALSTKPRSPSRWNPSIPLTLERVTLKALSKDPAARYQSAGELAEELDEIAPERMTFTGATLPAFAVPAPAESAPPVPTARYALAAGLGLIALIGFIIAGYGAPLAAAGLLVAVVALVLDYLLVLLTINRRSRSRPVAWVTVGAPLGSDALTRTPPVQVGGVLEDPGDGVAYSTIAPPVTSPDPAVQPGTAESAGPTTGEWLPLGTTLIMRPGSAEALGVLVVLTGALKGITVPVNPDGVQIGTLPGNELVLDDPHVERRHARVRTEGGHLELVDLASATGTWVNGVKLASKRLHDHDEIRVGDTFLLFKEIRTSGELTPDARQRLHEFDQIWRALLDAACDGDMSRFAGEASRLIEGPLCRALGYRVEQLIPPYKGMIGHMIQAPQLWIRHSRFPIILIAYDQSQAQPSLLEDVNKLMQIARATEFFALLVVIPTQPGTGNEAEELRKTVSHSVYRQDYVVLDYEHLASIIAQASSERLVEIILAQGIELSTVSPYVVVGPVPEDMFFGREGEIRTLVQRLGTRSYAILGGRRIGKSSILRQVARLLNNDPRYRVFESNWQVVATYSDLFDVLGADFPDTPRPQTPFAVRELIRALAARHSPCQLIFALDETDALIAHDAGRDGSGALAKMLRALSQEGTCHFMFSGSKTLFEHLRNPTSPFFNFCEQIRLGPLEDKSVAEILVKPMRQLHVELDDEENLVLELIDASGSHPNLVQWICSQLLQSMGSRRRVTLADLQAITASSPFKKYLVGTVWQDLAPLERLITLILDRPSFEMSDLHAGLARYGFDGSAAIRQALNQLELFAFLEQQGSTLLLTYRRFPEIIREIEDVPLLIPALVKQLEV